MSNQINHELFDKLDAVCKLAARQFGKPDISSWAHKDYLFFSNHLFKTTSVQLSPSTLKRIFGKLKTAERYFPQLATRNALAQYAGFKDWQEFIGPENAIQPSSIVHITDELIEDSSSPTELIIIDRSVTKKSSNRIWMLAGIFAILLAGIFGYNYYWKAFELPTGVRLICKNPDGKIPHTAFFSLQLPDSYGMDGDFMIDFGNGRTHKKILPNTTLSNYYEIPGRYYALLRYKNKVIDTSIVYLKSKGWAVAATTPKDTTRAYPIDPGFIRKDGALYVGADKLRQAGIDTNYTFFVDFVNTQPVKISADNFELKTHLNTSANRAGVRCSPLYLFVYGEKSPHYFYIHKDGCEAWNEARIGEWFIEGGKNDMHNFTADLSSGADIRFRVENKSVSIWINERKIFTTSYKKSVGEIYGICIRFAGIGSIGSFFLRDLKSGRLFDGNF